ncbi:hypothetical protein IFR04_015970, partial [Cadophora malorum]
MAGRLPDQASKNPIDVVLEWQNKKAGNMTSRQCTKPRNFDLQKLMLQPTRDLWRCEDNRATSSTVKARRAKLIKSFHEPSASSKRKTDIIAQLNKTYQHPPAQVPRSEMWDLHFSFVEESAKIGEPEKVIEHVLAAFESVGFVIEGARTTPVPGKKLIVKKWGAPHTGATSAFLSLRNVYKLFELTELAEQAKEYARISWMLLAGGIPLLYMIIHQR